MKTLKTIFPCLVWVAFGIIGIVQKRFGIFFVSIIFCGLSILLIILRQKRSTSSQKMWNSFISENPDLKDVHYHIWRFVEGPEYRKNIFKRILDGEVSGESFSTDLFDANGEPLPEVGQYNVICDERNQAYCIVKTVQVLETTFDSVNPHMANIEGCDSVEKWKKYNKIKYERICEKLDIEFNRGLPLIFEEFEIVYKWETSA